MANHEESHPIGQEICDRLFARMVKLLPGLHRIKKSNCGFFQEGNNRFAYL
jgi:hypothetical protein